MQRKLTESEIEKLKQARAAISDVLFPAYGDHGRYWAEVLLSLGDKIRHGTSDGKPPWVELEPEIPEGWRKAEPCEWKRTDVKFWSSEKNSWVPRFHQGLPFDPMRLGKTYIVPIDQPLTDHDACVWPRLLVMVRDEESKPWEGPFRYVGLHDDDKPFPFVVYRFVVYREDGLSCAWKYARRATPAEIEAAAMK